MSGVLSSLIRVNSVDAISDIKNQTKSNFYVNLGEGLNNNKVIRMVVKSIQFPNVFENVNKYNNTFSFLDNGVGRQAVLTNGRYEANGTGDINDPDLLYALKVAIDGVLGAGSVAIIIEKITYKLRFTFTGTAGDVVLLGADNGNAMGNLLGITSDLTANAGNTYSVTAQSTPRLYGLQEVFLKIREISGGNLLDPQGVVKNIFINIPFQGTKYGGIVYFENQAPTMCDVEYVKPINLKGLHIELVDRQDRYVDLQNHNLRMVLKAYYVN